MGIVSSMQKMQEGMALKMQQAQKEAQQRMMQNKLAGMKKRQAMEIAFKKAAARENVKWTGTVWGLAVTAAIAHKVQGKPVSPLLRAPIAILTVGSLYLADIGWGGKVERIKKEAMEIFEKENKPEDFIVTLPGAAPAPAPAQTPQ